MSLHTAPKEAIAYLAREKVQSEALLATFGEIAEHIEFGEHKPPWGTLPVELGIRFRQARLAWIDDAIAHFRTEARRKL